MRRQSSRGASTAAARRKMWQQMGPTACARCSGAQAVDLHEPLCRSRGGDAADPMQCWPVCRKCHDYIHDHPAEATAEGWLVPSWEADEFRERRR
jgi:hypothetical protein